MAEPGQPAALPARKALGQHFLFDPDILRRIASATGPLDGAGVIEVGPGPGGLTRALLDAGAGRVLAVEADPRFAEALRAWPETAGGRLVVIGGDARRVDWPAEIARHDLARPVRIVANLPYNVATPLIVGWLMAGGWRGPMALMVQKEVGERLCAAPGTPAYGRLAVLAAAVDRASIAFTLPPGAFRPPPKVDSAVVVFEPLPQVARFARLDALQAVTAAAFGQRRKMLRVSMKGLAKAHGLEPGAWIEAAGLDPTQRAETVDQTGFRTLAETLPD